MSSRVVYTAPMSGVDFLVNTITGVNSCPAGYHPAQAWEAMILDVVGETYVATQTAWVTGSFPTFDHMRTLVNGQDSNVCPDSKLLVKYASPYVNGQIQTVGGLHCEDKFATHPVMCAINR